MLNKQKHMISVEQGKERIFGSGTTNTNDEKRGKRVNAHHTPQTSLY
jgi:hypothetical protein